MVQLLLRQGLGWVRAKDKIPDVRLKIRIFEDLGREVGAGSGHRRTPIEWTA